MAISVFALQAATDVEPQDAVEAETTTGPEIEVVEERSVKKEKITDKSDPDYVRCKSEAVLGSRARRKRTCMTNREWELVARRGNEATREFVDRNQPGFDRIPGQN